MRLSRDQRARIFAGEAPPLVGEGRCPVNDGDVVRLSSKVSLKVLKVRKRRRGGWSLFYEVHDRRDPVRRLRRTPGMNDESFEAIRRSFDEFGTPEPPTAEVLAAAAQESAYTTVPTRLSEAWQKSGDEGEGVDEASQARFVKQAEMHAGQETALQQARRKRYELEQRLLRAREDASLRGVDISSPMRVIERQLQKIERRVYQGKAA